MFRGNHPTRVDEKGRLKLPAEFGQLRQRLTRELGDRAGTRHYIRVLQLLGRHTAEQVAQAIGACLSRQVLRAEFIEQKLSGRGLGDSVPVDHSIIDRVNVPLPDLRRFDQLLTFHPSIQGEPNDVTDALEAQPQNTAAADDAGRICQAVA